MVPQRGKVTLEAFDESGGFCFAVSDMFLVPTGIVVQFEDLSSRQLEKDGGFVTVNNNFDEGNVDADNHPIPDNQPDASAGQRIVANDPDLRKITLHFVNPLSPGGTWSINYPSSIKVWKNGQEIQPNQAQNRGSATEIELMVEGLTASTAVRDITLSATYIPSQGQASTHAIRLTIAEVKLAVDANRDGEIEIDGQADKTSSDQPLG